MYFKNKNKNKNKMHLIVFTVTTSISNENMEIRVTLGELKWGILTGVLLEVATMSPH